MSCHEMSYSGTQGRCRANNWQGALELYPQLDAMLSVDDGLSRELSGDSVEEEGEGGVWDGKRARGSLAYHWIAEAMLRDGATEALADFLVQENI